MSNGSTIGMSPLNGAGAAVGRARAAFKASAMTGSSRVMVGMGTRKLGLNNLARRIIRFCLGQALVRATGVPQQSGSHGYLASDPEMDAIFIASGFGVKPGTKLERVANIDVAPTIAKLLSVP